MNTTQTREKHTIGTERPAPFLPGLCSLQIIPDPASKTPEITSYRLSRKEAQSAMRRHVNRGVDATYAIRSDLKKWEFYDGDGKFVKTSDSVQMNYNLLSCQVIDTDRDVILDEVREHVGPGMALLCCAEEHANASAADHLNFRYVCRRLILEAKPDELEHIHVVESRRWPCRVITIVADVSQLSEKLQNAYLDRHQWLASSFPLNMEEHVDQLADRLARSRSDYMVDLLAQCAHLCGMDPELALSMKSKWLLASPGSKFRFAQKIVRLMQWVEINDEDTHGITYSPGRAEFFTLDAIRLKRREILENFRTFVR